MTGQAGLLPGEPGRRSRTTRDGLFITNKKLRIMNTPKKYFEEYVNHIKQYRELEPGESIGFENGYIVHRAKDFVSRMTLPELIEAVREQREFRKTHKPPQR